jgi:hypothetical protein
MMGNFCGLRFLQTACPGARRFFRPGRHFCHAFFERNIFCNLPQNKAKNPYAYAYASGSEAEQTFYPKIQVRRSKI